VPNARFGKRLAMHKLDLRGNTDEQVAKVQNVISAIHLHNGYSIDVIISRQIVIL
jgi:hypothetical protein